MVGRVLLLYICAIDVGLCNKKSVVSRLLCHVVIQQAAIFHGKRGIFLYILLLIVRV